MSHPLTRQYLNEQQDAQKEQRPDLMRHHDSSPPPMTRQRLRNSPVSLRPIFQRFNLEWKNRTLKLFTQAA
jgi:hypothetical protein